MTSRHASSMWLTSILLWKHLTGLHAFGMWDHSAYSNSYSHLFFVAVVKSLSAVEQRAVLWNNGLRYISDAKVKKKEKRCPKRLLQPIVSLEDLLDSPMFKKFNSCVEAILDSAEDANFASLDKGNALLNHYCLIEVFISAHVWIGAPMQQYFCHRW